MPYSAEFIGGPADGQLRAFPDDHPPQALIVMGSVYEEGQLRTKRWCYRPRVNFDPAGPPWLMDFVAS